MAHPAPTAPRHTGLAILGIAAIPFVAVTAVSWLGDVASTTDPRQAVAGALGLLGGLVMGLLVRRMIRSVDSQVRSLGRRLVRVAHRLSQPPASTPAAHRLLLRLGLAPVVAFVPADTGRRGPPARV